MKFAPASVEILTPSPVAAYTVAPTAYTPYTVLLPRPLVVVRLVKFAPPSVEILNPPYVAAQGSLTRFPGQFRLGDHAAVLAAVCRVSKSCGESIPRAV